MKFVRLYQDNEYDRYSEPTVVYDLWLSHPFSEFYGTIYSKFSPLPVLFFEKDAHHHLEHYWYVGWLWFYFVFAWEIKGTN